MTPVRVMVIGNSVALYVRPRVSGERAYPHRLAGLLGPDRPVDLEVCAENSLTAWDLLKVVEDRLPAFSPDLVIVNVGVVDCTPRILPQRLRRFFVRGRTRAERASLAAEAMIRRPVVRLLGGASALSLRDFESAIRRIVEIARAEAGARVVCLGLPPTSPRVVREVPGMEDRLRRFDEAIRAVCQAVPGALYLDTGALVAEAGGDRVLPDGIHFSAEGHARVAAALVDLVEAAPDSPPPASTADREPPAHSSGLLVRLPGLLLALPLVAFAAAWIVLVRAARALSGGRS